MRKIRARHIYCMVATLFLILYFSPTVVKASPVGPNEVNLFGNSDFTLSGEFSGELLTGGYDWLYTISNNSADQQLMIDEIRISPGYFTDLSVTATPLLPLNTDIYTSSSYSGTPIAFVGSDIPIMPSYSPGYEGWVHFGFNSEWQDESDRQTLSIGPSESLELYIAFNSGSFDNQDVVIFNNVGVADQNTLSYAAPVPEPATMLLLGTGLVGIAGISRRKFFKK